MDLICEWLTFLYPWNLWILGICGSTCYQSQKADFDKIPSVSQGALTPLTLFVGF